MTSYISLVHFFDGRIILLGEEEKMIGIILFHAIRKEEE
jgi:hypothetical protein